MPRCTKCDKEIVFLRTTTGKTAPVNVDSLPENEFRMYHQQPKTYSDTHLFNPKTHLNHFATCPHAAQFRKEKK